GEPHGGFSDPATQALLDAKFAELSASGVRTVRYMSLFADLRAGVTFAEDGTPTGFTEHVDADIEALFDAARRHHLRLIPVLLDFGIADTVTQEADAGAVGEHPDVITDPAKRQALLRLFR